MVIFNSYVKLPEGTMNDIMIPPMTENFSPSCPSIEEPDQVGAVWQLRVAMVLGTCANGNGMSNYFRSVSCY